MIQHSIRSGITLYIAIIIASIVTFISFAVSNIGFQQLQLADLGQKSQHAFYAANSGVECALYWDTKVSDVAFIESENDTPPPAHADDDTVDCNAFGGGTGSDTAWQAPAAADEDSATTTFVINNLGGEVEACTTVVVGKHSGDYLQTVVRASGRSNLNDCTTDNDDIPEESVERTIEVTY